MIYYRIERGSPLGVIFSLVFVLLMIYYRIESIRKLKSTPANSINIDDLL